MSSIQAFCSNTANRDISDYYFLLNNKWFFSVYDNSNNCRIDNLVGVIQHPPVPLPIEDFVVLCGIDKDGDVFTTIERPIEPLTFLTLFGKSPRAKFMELLKVRTLNRPRNQQPIQDYIVEKVLEGVAKMLAEAKQNE